MPELFQQSFENAGNTALTEVIYQLMHDGLVKFLELGGLSSALFATLGVNAVFMVVKAIRARGGIHFGKNTDSLREDLNATGIAATVAEMFKGDVGLEVILAGIAIAFFLGTMLPAIYPKMVSKRLTFATSFALIRFIYPPIHQVTVDVLCRRGHGLSKNS